MNDNTTQTTTGESSREFFHALSSTVKAELSPILLMLQRATESLEKIANQETGTTGAETIGTESTRAEPKRTRRRIKAINKELTPQELTALRNWLVSPKYIADNTSEHARHINEKLLGVASLSRLLALWAWAGPTWFETVHGRRLYMAPKTNKTEQFKPFMRKSQTQLENLRNGFKVLRTSAGLSLAEAAHRVSGALKSIKKPKPDAGFRYGKILENYAADPIIGTYAWMSDYESPCVRAKALTSWRCEALFEAYGVFGGENLETMVSHMPEFLIEDFRRDLPNSRIFTVVERKEPLAIPAHIRNTSEETSTAETTKQPEASEDVPRMSRFTREEDDAFLSGTHPVAHNTTLNHAEPEMGKRFSVVIK